MKPEIYAGRLRIGGKIYACSVIDGVPYIDGKTVEEFEKTLSWADRIACAIVGKRVVENVKSGKKKSEREYQELMDKTCAEIAEKEDRA